MATPGRRCSTERFLELLEKQNQDLADREAEKDTQKTGEDPVRLQREAERREKWGELRARERPSKRPHRGRHLFGYTDLSGGD